jgi:hypothetical protein
MRYFKRRWDESRGDQYDSWGPSNWYFEVGDDGYAVRQLEQYEGGPILKYDETHLDDEFGGLGEKPLDLEEFAAFEIDRAEFEVIWSSLAAKNRQHGAV